MSKFSLVRSGHKRRSCEMSRTVMVLRPGALLSSRLKRCWVLKEESFGTCLSIHQGTMQLWCPGGRYTMLLGAPNGAFKLMLSKNGSMSLTSSMVNGHSVSSSKLTRPTTAGKK
jgi:hypothetical protein